MSEEEARLLAEIHAARTLMRAASAPARPSAAAQLSAAALWAHATREPGAPADLAVIRAIRADPDAARRYRTLLAGQALAHAPMAVAAAHGPVAARRIGPYALEILEATEDGPPLLILTGESLSREEARPPRLIEVMLGDETLRIALPPPVAGAILLAVDPAVPEVVRLGAMLRDPACAAYLL